MIVATCQTPRHVSVEAHTCQTYVRLFLSTLLSLLVYCRDGFSVNKIEEAKRRNDQIKVKSQVKWKEIIKSTMQAVKQTAANIAASALSGMEKTKAVVEEKVEKISTSDPIEKDIATLRKEDRIRMAELRKREAFSQNAAAAEGGPNSPTFTAAGHVHPEKNPFQLATGDAKNTDKPVAVQQSHGATVEKATPAVQPTNAMST